MSVLDGARIGVRLCSVVSPDGAEVCCLPQAWDDAKDAAYMDATHGATSVVQEIRRLVQML